MSTIIDTLNQLAGRLRRIMDEKLRRSPRLSVMGMLLVVLLAGLLLPGLRSGADEAGQAPASLPENETSTPSSILDTRIQGPVQGQQIDFNDIITLVGSETGLPYTIDQGVFARVTFSLQDPTVREVLDTILPGQGLDYLVNQYGIVRIGHASMIAEAKQKPPSPPDESTGRNAALLDTRLQGPMIAQRSDFNQIVTLLGAETGLRFSLDRGVNPRVTFHLQDPSVREILDTILPGQGLDYLVTEKGVIRIGPAVVIAQAKQMSLPAPEKKTGTAAPVLDVRIQGPMMAQESDLAQIMTLLGAETGLPFTIDQGVSARVTFQLQDPSAREILDTILPGQGLDYLVTEHGVIRIGRAATIMRIKHKPEELVTVVFVPKHASVDAVKESLTKVMTEQGELILDRDFKRIVATDTRDAIANMYEIAEKIDFEAADRRTPTPVQLMIAVFRLAHISKEDLMDALAKVKSFDGKIVVDSSSNSFVVTDTPDAVGKMLMIVEKLDVEAETPAAIPKPETPAAKAGQLAAKIFGPLHVPFDVLKEPLESVKSEQGRFVFIEDSKQIAVFDTPDVIAKMEKILAELDSQTETRVFKIEHADVTSLAEELRGVINTQEGELVVDEDNRILVITDTVDRLNRAEAIIQQLDSQPETVTGESSRVGRSRVALPKPTPTPRPLAQNYKIRNILGSSAILIDYRLMPIVVREGQTVDDPLGNFRVMEVDAKGRRVRVKLLSTGQERWIKEWQRPRGPRRR